MIYGYSEKIVDEEYGLLQLREISFEFAPRELKRIAAFLNSAAEAIEKDTLRSSHIHIGSSAQHWSADCPNCEIIVLHPRPETPAIAD